MPSLKTTIAQLSADFAASIIKALRGASVAELLAVTGKSRVLAKNPPHPAEMAKAAVKSKIKPKTKAKSAGKAKVKTKRAAKQPPITDSAIAKAAESLRDMMAESGADGMAAGALKRAERNDTLRKRAIALLLTTGRARMSGAKRGARYHAADPDAVAPEAGEVAAG